MLFPLSTYTDHLKISLALKLPPTIPSTSTLLTSPSLTTVKGASSFKKPSSVCGGDIFPLLTLTEVLVKPKSELPPSPEDDIIILGNSLSLLKAIL